MVALIIMAGQAQVAVSACSQYSHFDTALHFTNWCIYSSMLVLPLAHSTSNGLANCECGRIPDCCLQAGLLVASAQPAPEPSAVPEPSAAPEPASGPSDSTPQPSEGMAFGADIRLSQCWYQKAALPPCGPACCQLIATSSHFLAQMIATKTVCTAAQACSSFLLMSSKRATQF